MEGSAQREKWGVERTRLLEVARVWSLGPSSCGRVSFLGYGAPGKVNNKPGLEKGLHLKGSVWWEAWEIVKSWGWGAQRQQPICNVGSWEFPEGRQEKWEVELLG